MNKYVKMLSVAAIAGLSLFLCAAQVTEVIDYWNRVTFHGSIVNVEGVGALQIAGTAVTGSAAEINAAVAATSASGITEEMLKAVDSASDEDFLSYESTTGDFEWHSAAEIQAKFTEGSYADSTVVSADIKDGDIVNADVSASAGIVVSKLGTSGRGTTNNAAPVTETVGEVCRTSLAVSSNRMAIANGGLTTNQLLYTFPIGRILVHGVSVRLVSTNSAAFETSDTDHYSFSLGGAGNGDSTADAAEVTFMAAKDCDTAAGTVLAFTNATTTASFVVNGTSTAAPLWAHIFVANTQDTGNNTFGLTGTVVVTWSNLGPY